MVGTDVEEALWSTLALAMLCLVIREDDSKAGALVSESLWKEKSQDHFALRDLRALLL